LSRIRGRRELLESNTASGCDGGLCQVGGTRATDL